MLITLRSSDRARADPPFYRNTLWSSACINKEAARQCLFQPVKADKLSTGSNMTGCVAVYTYTQHSSEQYATAFGSLFARQTSSYSYGALAQLARAIALQAIGHRFEADTLHIISIWKVNSDGSGDGLENRSMCMHWGSAPLPSEFYFINCRHLRR